MEHLNPGAWFELAEVGSVVGSDDNSVPEDWPPKRCLDLAGEGLAKIGRVSPDGEWMEKLLKDGGFVDVKVSPSRPTGHGSFPHPTLETVSDHANSSGVYMYLKHTDALCVHAVCTI